MRENYLLGGKQADDDEGFQVEFLKACILNKPFHITTGNMKVADLKTNNNVDEIVLKIVEKSEPREVQRRFGGAAHVCDLVGEDTDGETVKITLWNDEIDTVDINETIQIKDGWVKEWNNELQLSTGRSSTIEKIS